MGEPEMYLFCFRQKEYINNSKWQKQKAFNSLDLFNLRWFFTFHYDHHLGLICYFIQVPQANPRWNHTVFVPSKTDRPSHPRHRWGVSASRNAAASPASVAFHGWTRQCREPPISARDLVNQQATNSFGSWCFLSRWGDKKWTYKLKMTKKNMICFAINFGPFWSI